MSAFKIKLGIGLMVLIIVFFLSQGIYKKNISTLHDYIYEAIDFTEQMHTAELFHTSMHEMLILAGNYAEKPGKTLKEGYDNYSLKADNALKKLRHLTISTEDMNDHRSTEDREFCIDCVENITSRFALLKKQLDAVFLSTGDERTVHLNKAKEIFDDIFHNYYVKLHNQHQKQITDVKEKSHRVKRTMDVYFIAQLFFALLCGALVLFYFDRTVLKLYAVTEHLTVTDPLTSLHNRHYLKRYMEEEIDRSVRYNKQFSIAMIDIDNFKKYNDTYGHQAGDKLLKDLSSLLKKNIRKTDRAIRYGGEELLVAFPETPKSAAFEAAEKIRNTIASHTFMLPDKNPSPPVTISAGIASFPDDGYSGEAVIKKADDMLYKAKNEGKNIVKVS